MLAVMRLAQVVVIAVVVAGVQKMLAATQVAQVLTLVVQVEME
jgi:hypothetical protein